MHLCIIVSLYFWCIWCNGVFGILVRCVFAYLRNLCVGLLVYCCIRVSVYVGVLRYLCIDVLRYLLYLCVCAFVDLCMLCIVVFMCLVY